MCATLYLIGQPTVKETIINFLRKHIFKESELYKVYEIGGIDLILQILYSPEDETVKLCYNLLNQLNCIFAILYFNRESNI